MRLIFLFFLTLFFMSCTEVFTTSLFESFAKDVDDMTVSEIEAYISTMSLSDISDEDLLTIEEKLADSRVELTEADLQDSELVEKFLDQTSTLIEINMEQADVEGLITDILTLEDGADATDLLTTAIEDPARLENLEAAADYAVQAYDIDPESLTSTEIIVGSMGLISDIIQDDANLTALENVTDYETTTLESAGFSTEEIEDIQQAVEMLQYAESNLSGDMADLFEGLPI